jgi:hypothetical protein
MRNNNFTYAHPGADLLSDQTRKTAPGGNFSPVNTQNHILRSSISYGPEGEASFIALVSRGELICARHARV